MNDFRLQPLFISRMTTKCGTSTVRSSGKKCPCCTEEKELDLFHKDTSTKDGYYGICKSCKLESTQEYRNHHKSRIREYSRKYWKRNKSRKQEYDRKRIQTFQGRYGHWKSGAKRRGIHFDLTLSDVESMPLVCHYTGMPLTLNSHDYYTVSLDRLDSNKGYTKDNVVFCCEFVNRMKIELSYEQFITACGMIFQHCNGNNK